MPTQDERIIQIPLSGEVCTPILSGLIIAGLKLGREVVYTYATRCGTPENREATPEEAESCWPWLEKELEVLQPSIIVTLGKPVLQLLARKWGFSNKVGQLHISKLAGKPIFVSKTLTYIYPQPNPLFIYRRRTAREEFQESFRFLKVSMDGWVERTRSERDKRKRESVPPVS